MGFLIFSFVTLERVRYNTQSRETVIMKLTFTVVFHLALLLSGLLLLLRSPEISFSEQPVDLGCCLSCAQVTHKHLQKAQETCRG